MRDIADTDTRFEEVPARFTPLELAKVSSD